MALLAACGGSNSSSSASSPTATTSASALTKAQFITRADAICTRANAKLKSQQNVINAALKADQANDTATNRQALGEAMNRGAQIASPLLDQLRALQPPASDRVVVAKYLSGVASQINLLQQFATAVENDDARGVKTISQQFAQGKASVRGLAQGYGFKVCGSGTS